MVVISSDCSSVVNRFQDLVPVWDTSRNRYYPLLVYSSVPLANSYVNSWVEWENPEISEGQRSIDSVC